MAPALSMNDTVLILSLLYLSFDLQNQWAEFEHCKWPVNRFLFLSFMFIVAFRLIHVFGTMHSDQHNGDFLLNLRHKSALPRLLLSLTWLAVLPLYACWTALGTYWLWESKRLSDRCLPLGMPLGFAIVWLFLSYAWIIIHTVLGCIAWILERRLRRTEASLREIADPDTVERWGAVGELPGYTALANNSLGGLAPEQIKCLPCARVSDLKLGEDAECSICLGQLCQEDMVRQLHGCGHMFHRSCIDLWLLRRADCPLCKQDVSVTAINAAEEAPGCEHWHV